MQLVTEVWEFAMANPWVWMAAVGVAVVWFLAWAIRVSAH